MVEILGGWILSSGEGVARFCTLAAASQRALFAGMLRGRLRWDFLVAQLSNVAVASVWVVTCGVGFLSLMLVTEFSFHMKLILRQDSLVPAFSTLLLIRELGPVVTALLLVSRVGAGMAAELATMKETSQLDALRLMALDPVAFLMPPRILACVFGSVALTLIALGVGMGAGASLAAVALGYGVREFFNTMFVFVGMEDLWGCLLKAFVFGNLIPLAAAYHGFRAAGGSAGVGRAATDAVVQGSVLVIFADFFLTYALYR